MADLTRASVGVDALSVINGGLRISELFAGEALSALDLVRIASDGTVMQAVTTSVEDTTVTASQGFVAKDYAVGQPVTILGAGCVFQYAESGLTPGALYFGSATAGNIADARVLATDTPKAKAISATHIVAL